VFSHIDRGPSVFAAKGQALCHAQRDQDDRCRDTPALIAGQKAHEKGRKTHDQDRHQEGVFPPDQIAQRPEDQRAERGKELRADDGGKRSKQIEVVPFKDCPCG
jgi:hypothetical protein